MSGTTLLGKDRVSYPVRPVPGVRLSWLRVRYQVQTRLGPEKGIHDGVITELLVQSTLCDASPMDVILKIAANYTAADSAS